MAISRMQIPRQLRAGGGIMTLEEPRQGFFLGKIVKKAKRAVKKIVKSPVGKLAILGGLGAYAGGLGPFANLKGAGFLRGAGSGLLSGLKSKEGFLGTIGNAFRVGGDPTKGFSGLRLLGGGLGAAAIAAPFLMGGDEEVEEETPFTQTPDSISSIVNMAKNQDPSLRFLPKPKFVDNFYAADGGLANLDTPKRGMVDGPGSYAGLKNKPNIFVTPGGDMERQPPGKFDFLTTTGPLTDQQKEILANMSEEEIKELQEKGTLFDFLENIIKTPFIIRGGDTTYADGGLASMRPGYNEGESVLSKEQMAMINDMKKKGMDMSTIESMTGATADQITNYLSSLNQKQEGGLMDLGGLEKDYREGGFVPLGAEERADDVPARLSKNEFVFTADAVRNAGQGDIDKGAEVMQNMMDNLEAGGTISEESQGMNPAQEMFDQAQMLEGRLA